MCKNLKKEITFKKKMHQGNSENSLINLNEKLANLIDIQCFLNSFLGYTHKCDELTIVKSLNYFKLSSEWALC